MFTFIQSRLLLVATLALVLALSYLFFQYRRIQELKSKSSSYESLYRLQIDSLRLWRDKKNQSHLEGEVGIVSSKDIFLITAKQESLLKDLQGKINKLEAYRITSTNSNYNFHTFYKDSILVDSTHVKITNFKDPKGWYSFKEVMVGDSSQIEFHSVDSLVSGIYKGKCQKRVFWNLIGIGNRNYKVEILNKNPNSTINYNKEVYLKK